MNKIISIKLDSSYKEKRLQLILNVFLAFIMGPFIIFIMIYTAVTNKVDDPKSLILLVIASLLFCYLSYSKFKYIYLIYFGTHTAEIDYENKAILFKPFNETILIENVSAFVYMNKSKRYIFRHNNEKNTILELKQNKAFENEVKRFSLECKVE
jgi:hypothetical protein